MRLSATPGRQLSDDVLLTQIARGDVGALETLYDRHAAIVLGMALKITQDQAMAENILQETFWKVWQIAATYQPEQAFVGWLFRIARSLALETHRKSNIE